MPALIVDAGALYAQADADEPQHEAVANVLRDERDALVTSQVVVAEADYLILRRLGVAVELLFLDDLAAGTYVVDALTAPELGIARDLVARYRDLEIGLADASLVVLANRWETRRILTLDERAFRTVAPLQGGSFTLLPADAGT
ncbi:MAG: VapC toxin family PIN domain ribonuclease [Solirubrobacteraceae bacterium]